MIGLAVHSILEGTARSPAVDSIKEDIVRNLAAGSIREGIAHTGRLIGLRGSSPAGSTEEDILGEDIRPQHIVVADLAYVGDIAVDLVDIEGISGARKQFWLGDVLILAGLVDPVVLAALGGLAVAVGLVEVAVEAGMAEEALVG